MRLQMSIDHKIETLVLVAKLFNQHSITWVLGASCMLYLRGIVDDFHDIDMIVCLEDMNKVKELLNQYMLSEFNCNELYKTKEFIEYRIQNVDIDIMADFTIVNNHKEYVFPLKKGTKRDHIVLNHSTIYLDTVSHWLKYYQLMGRVDKVKMIKNYLNQ